MTTVISRWFAAWSLVMGLAMASAQARAQAPAQPQAGAFQFERKPTIAYFDKFNPILAPKPARLLLQKGDRLAICGDSITEQRMYSRILETYLTVCVPELDVTVRQFGWSGERVPGFVARMTNDCLRFKPTIATTCYGMNDHEYRVYEERIGKTYENATVAMIKAFQSAGARVVLGSPGCVSLVPRWGNTNATVDQLNWNLCQLRNIDILLAQSGKTGFADVFWPMLKAGYDAQHRFSPNYMIAGRDGVHPGWAGHTLMAYSFLKALGVSGEIGTLTIDLRNGQAAATTGHEVTGANGNSFTFTSQRYPFSHTFIADTNSASDNSIRSAMNLVPFNEDLNRLMLVVKGGRGQRMEVNWGGRAKIYSAAELNKGINLAVDFPDNPFTAAFKNVDEAVRAKQEFETKQIKQIFHGAEGKADMEGAVARTEAERAKLADAIRAAHVPVTHTLKVGLFTEAE